MNDPSLSEMILRLILALAGGLMLGLERGLKHKPVDFRVYVVVSVTSALVAMVANELVASLPLDKAGLAVDPLRTYQTILMGIAFLGSATIIKHEDRVIGTATGAAVWASGAIGVTFGLGFYALACAAFLCIFLSLILLGLLIPDIEKSGQDDDETRR